MWRAIKLVATGVGWLLMAAGFLLIVYIVTFAQAFAAEPTAPGMLCTYKKQGDPGADLLRTYTVEVVGHFEASRDAGGKPWLWVKRPGQARYQSVLAEASDLSECQR